MISLEVGDENITLSSKPTFRPNDWMKICPSTYKLKLCHIYYLISWGNTLAFSFNLKFMNIRYTLMRVYHHTKLTWSVISRISSGIDSIFLIAYDELLHIYSPTTLWGLWKHIRVLIIFTTCEFSFDQLNKENDWLYIYRFNFFLSLSEIRRICPSQQSNVFN